jgi:hypothetical protein
VPTGRKRRLLTHAAVFVGFLLPSLVLFRQVLAAPGERLPGGNDGVLFSWWLGEVPHALFSGSDPLVTSLLNAPVGVNGMWTTSVPVLGILASPLTALAGPVVAMNVLFVLAPALSAWVCYLVLRRWVGSVSAVLGGLIYGYSPYVVGAAHGHLHLTLAVFPPLLLGLLDDLVEERRPSLRAGVWLGVAAGLQFYVAGEVLASSVLVAVGGLGLLALLHRGQVRAAVPRLARGLGGAGAVALLVLLPGVLVQFLGPHGVSGAVQEPGVAVTDLYGFVVPGPLQRFHTTGSLAVARQFTGPSVELGGYLGIPLILVALLVLVRRLLVRSGRAALPTWSILLALGVAVASLGPHLHIRGRDTGIVLPWRLVQNLPVTEQILPSRLSVYVLLLLVVALAWELDRCLRSTLPVRAVATGVAVVVLASLLPGTTLPSARLAAPRFFTTPAVRLLPADAPVLVVPYPWAGQPTAMLWQARADYRFRLIGGYFTGDRSDSGHRYFNASPSPLNLTLIALVQGRISTAAARSRLPAVRQDLAATGARAVVLGPCNHRPEVLAYLTELLGKPPQHVADVDVWLLG